MRAIIVAAVSTTAQAAEDKGSLEDQLSRCREACAVRGWHVAAEVVIPGHSRNYDWLHEIMAECPEYAALIRHITERTADLLVVRDYDRLWRTDALRAQVTALCRQHRVQVYSVNQPQELVDPERLRDVSDSRMILEALSGVLSEQENRARIRRSIQGRRMRIERQGRHLATVPPYGYRINANTDLEVQPGEARWVRWMFERRVQDRWGTPKIARTLTLLGVPTRNGQSRWAQGVVYGILRNPVYAGHARFGVAYNPNGAHEPLVPEETWRAAQTVGRGERSRRDDWEPALLTGLARCAHCGYAMHVNTTYADPPRRYLRCSRYLSTGGRECQANHMRAEPVEAFVLVETQRILGDPDAWREVCGQQAEGSAAEFADIESALATLARQWGRWSRAYEVGAISLDELLLHRERITGEREAHQARKREIEAAQDRAAAVLSLAASLSEQVAALPGLCVLQQRRVLHAVISRVLCAKGRPPEIVWALA